MVQRRCQLPKWHEDRNVTWLECWSCAYKSPGPETTSIDVFSAIHDLLYTVTLELIIGIAERVDSHKDLSALNRCDRTIHGHTQRHLYRDLIVTKFNACSLAAAIRVNSKLPLYCQKLTIQHTFTNENLGKFRARSLLWTSVWHKGSWRTHPGALGVFISPWRSLSNLGQKPSGK